MMVEELYEGGPCVEACAEEWFAVDMMNMDMAARSTWVWVAVVGMDMDMAVKLDMAAVREELAVARIMVVILMQIPICNQADTTAKLVEVVVVMLLTGNTINNL